MKPYVISLYSKDIMQGNGFCHPTKKLEYYIYGTNEPRHGYASSVKTPLEVYFADDELNAMLHAETLSINHPNVDVIVSKTINVVNSTVKEVKMNVLSYDDKKGLLPV